MVTNLKYGLFVTAVAFDTESEIIQYVVVEFSHDSRENHYMLLKTVGESLVGWLYDKQLLSCGYLKKQTAQLGCQMKILMIASAITPCGQHCTTE